jgi:hypothetical protein
VSEPTANAPSAGAVNCGGGVTLLTMRTSDTPEPRSKPLNEYLNRKSG